MKYIIDVPEGIGESQTIRLEDVSVTPYSEDKREEELWAFARKLLDETRNGGMSIYDIGECFGGTGSLGVVAKLSYIEAKNKYEKWIKNKNKKFCIGDEAIFADGSRFVVYNIFDDGFLCGSGVTEDGRTTSWSDINPKFVTKQE